MVTTPYRNRIVGQGQEAPDQLLASPRNWRIHPKAQQDALASVLERVGWVDDVIVNRQTGYVLDGHLRVSLAISRGEPSIPVKYVDLTPEEEALVLATFDPIGAMAVADREQLGALLESLRGDGVDALLAQIAQQNRITLEPVGGLTDPDDVPEAPAEPVSKRGDVWLCGEHRVMCGDSTSAEDVARLIDGNKPLLCVTDPPYGVEYDPAWRNEVAAEGLLDYAPSRVGPVANDDRADWSEAWNLFPGDVIYSWHPAGAPSLVHAAALQETGFAIRMQIIWAKSNFPIGRGDYHVQHEPCWYAVRDGQPARRTNDRTQTTLWEINLDKNVEGGHSTQKPVECMERPIRNHEFAEVYDPFLGSGTTIIAAERQGRRCYAMEIEPRYMDVSVRRWEQYTGRKAVLDGR